MHSLVHTYNCKFAHTSGIYINENDKIAWHVQFFDNDAIDFQQKILERSGLGDATGLSEGKAEPTFLWPLIWDLCETE